MACSHQALSSSGGGDVQEVDFEEWTQPRMLISAIPPTINPLWHKEGEGAGLVQGKFNGRGLQRVPERSWLSPQAPVKDPGPGLSCTAKASAQLQSCSRGPCTVCEGEIQRARARDFWHGTGLCCARWKDRVEFKPLPSSPP